MPRVMDVVGQPFKRKLTPRKTAVGKTGVREFYDRLGCNLSLVAVK